ncbi:unnamed protein product [Linum trigynum]|uniref:Uncharacterized protein n=1 Tax=Linum trigynum TaxID=586398 RepID=A0AAV2G7R0_9ROSI
MKNINSIQRIDRSAGKRNRGLILVDRTLETAKRRRSVNVVFWVFKLPSVEELDLEELVFKQTIMVAKSKMAIGNASLPSVSLDSDTLFPNERSRRQEGDTPTADRNSAVNGFWTKDSPIRRLSVRKIPPMDLVSENKGIPITKFQIPISWAKCSISRRYLFPRYRVGLGVPIGDLTRLLFKELGAGTQARSLTLTRATDQPRAHPTAVIPNSPSHAGNSSSSSLLPRSFKLLASPLIKRERLGGCSAGNGSVSNRGRGTCLLLTWPRPVGRDEMISNNNDSTLQIQAMAHVASDQVVQFSMEEVQSTKYRASHSLLGRVFTSNRISTTELREAALTHWLIQGRLRVVLAKHGLVEFMFRNEEARL